jgi:rhomboid family GlyGly-CTERM serine protease
LSGNIVHSNYPHLFLNLAGLWIFGFMFFDSLSLRTFIISTLFLCASVGIGLYLFSPELQKYYGFSGALYGLYLVGATTAILTKDLFTGIIVTLFIIGKIIWDLIYGGSSSSSELIGIPVAVHAHLYGAIGAVLISIGLYLAHLRGN